MRTVFVCDATHTEWVADDYWISETSDPTQLIAETMEELYEEIASYKLSCERVQPPQEKWRQEAGYKNRNSYTRVHFSDILEVVVPESRNWDDVGHAVNEDLILNTNIWVETLAKKQAEIEADRARKKAIANKAAMTKSDKKAAADLRAEKRRAILDRKHGT